MERETDKFREIAEMYGPGMMGLKLDPEMENPEASAFYKKLDSLSSTVNELRGAVRKLEGAENEEDEALYRSIAKKYADLIDRVWTNTRAQMVKMCSMDTEKPEGEPEVQQLVLKQIKTED